MGPVQLQEGQVATDLKALSRVLAASHHDTPSLHNVAVNNSSVHFGPKTYIDNVTIKQIISGDGPDNRAATPPGDPPKDAVKVLGTCPLCKCPVWLWGASALMLAFLGLLVSLAPSTTSHIITASPQHPHESHNINAPIDTLIDNVLLSPSSLRLISRREWLAQPPSGPLDPLSPPAHRVIITHTATEPCTDQASCVFQVRTIQTFHLESRNWYDIGYNFLVGGDGGVYEGRGWEKVGAHTKGYNMDSIGVAFIGTFNDRLPSERQLKACRLLIEEGLALKKISGDYQLYGHRQLIPTLSPDAVKVLATCPLCKCPVSQHPHESHNINAPIDTLIDNVLLSPSSLRLISRREWLAQPPSGPLDPLSPPAHRVIIIHTVTKPCTVQASCVFQVRTIQTFHLESRNWYDIGYNFLVGGDGGVYEGRGWEKVGAHTKGYNMDSIGVAFIGTFNDRLPSEKQLNACRLLIEEGLALKKISEDYQLYGHRQLTSTLSPGDVLFKEISTWPHFANKTLVH